MIDCSLTDLEIILTGNPLQIRLEDWGWDGTMEDAYDTRRPLIFGEDASWKELEDIPEQVYVHFLCLCACSNRWFVERKVSARIVEPQSKKTKIRKE